MNNQDEINSIAYRDILLNMILGLVTMIAITVLLINVKTKLENAQAQPPGNMIVHIMWPEGNEDVDLWLDGPGEMVPVGYSNKGGLLWNLLRDDLGKWPDATPINYENAYTRGVVAGEYTVNVHCYRCPMTPVPVDVEVSLNTGDPGSKTPLKVLVTTKVKLVTSGQERTAINFKLTEDGEIVPGSMNSVLKKLRSEKKSGDSNVMPPYMQGR
jgi:hypothetical protein